MLAWRELVKLSEVELAALDIAEMNLVCAASLPGSDRIDHAGCLWRLDDMADCVRRFTERVMPQFHRSPQEYRNSEPYFRSLAMVTVLERDLGFRYNPSKTSPAVPLEAADVFLHGALLGQGGTCGSLAILLVAVGRRLGYPLKLVEARTREFGHLFVRWEDGTTRLNLEAQGHGLNCYPDDYYRTGRYAITPVDERCGCLLKSMSPRTELAAFLMQRGLHFLDVGTMRNAVESFIWAYALQPENRMTWNRLAGTFNEWNARLERHKPREFPGIRMTWPEKQLPDNLPPAIERDFLLLSVTQIILTEPDWEQMWWGPLRAGLPVRVPRRAHILCHERDFEVSYEY